MSLDEFTQYKLWAEEYADHKDFDVIALRQKLNKEAIRIVAAYDETAKKLDKEASIHLLFMRYQATYLRELLHDYLYKLPSYLLSVFVEELEPAVNYLNNYFINWEAQNPVSEDEKKQLDDLLELENKIWAVEKQKRKLLEETDALRSKIKIIEKTSRYKKRKIYAIAIIVVLTSHVLINISNSYFARGTISCKGKSTAYLLFAPTTSPGWDWSVCDLKNDTLFTGANNSKK